MKKILIFAGIIIVISSALFIISKKNNRRAHGKVMHAQRGTIAIEFRQTGSISPRNRLEIKPSIAGRLDDILVSEGQSVKKGDTIAMMSSVERASLIDAARARGKEELKKWEDTYKPAPIIAPLDGFIIDRSREPGQSVSSGDTILVMADKLIIEANIDETDLRYVHLGQKVTIMLDAYPGKEFEGIVEHIAYESTVINNVTVYTVKIRPASTGIFFRAGMTSTIIITAEKKENALLLPYEAIIKRGDQSFVLLKSETGKPRMQKIDTGINNGKQIEIISGITEEDTVITPEKFTKGQGDRERQSSSPLVPGFNSRRR